MAYRVFALLLIVAGVAGVILPILPGLPLLILGVAMVGPDHPLVRPVVRLIARLRP